MNVGSRIHRRKTMRLQEYDSSQAGGYFITICTHEKECLFGEVVDGEVQLNEIGRIVKSEWLKTEEIRDNVSTDEFVIMPNHVHGILFIDEPAERFGQPTSNLIPTINRSFKAAIIKQINELRNTPVVPVWQRSFYDRIVRNDDELNKIREYILNNPLKWQLDTENPEISELKSTQD